MLIIGREGEEHSKKVGGEGQLLQRIIPPNEQKERLIKGRVIVQVEMLTTKNKDLRRSKLQVMKLSRLTEKEIETEGDKETEWERERERQRERERARKGHSERNRKT